MTCLYQRERNIVRNAHKSLRPTLMEMSERYERERLAGVRGAHKGDTAQWRFIVRWEVARINRELRT